MIKLPLPGLQDLHTTRLDFRRPEAADVIWWMEYINDATAIRFMPFTRGNEADARMFIDRSMERAREDGSGLHAVIDRHKRQPVGMIGLLTQTVDGAPELEIGYHLLPSAWGNGFASEAAIACKEFVRDLRLSPSVISLIDPDNTRSQAVAKRNGMTMEKDTVHRGTPAQVWRVNFGDGLA